jgi:hypothetical protein
MKRCSKCTLSEATPNIEFDSDGVCNYCSTHQKIEYKGEEEFKAILDKHRSKDAKYDCIAAISGGRDSSYILLKLVRDYKMKVLAVNYANPFTDPQAKKNIENAVKELNVDLVTVYPKKDIHRRTYSSNLRTWCKRPSLGILPMICIACKLMWHEILKIARKKKISLVVGGLNRFEDTSYKKALLGIPMNESWETTYIKSFFGVLKEVIKNPAYIKPSFIPTIFKAYFFGDPYALGSRFLQRKITLTDMFYYIPWDEKIIIPRIKKELKWEKPAYLDSTWRFDCQVVLLKDLIYMKSFGITEKDDLYSKMVREGLLSRDEALKRLEKENKIHPEQTKRLAAEAGIDYDHFLEVLDKHSQLKKQEARSENKIRN